MKILGAILAGGQSRRFGSDKAIAPFQGKALLDHAADALRPHCAKLIVVGREWPETENVADHPAAGMGPLGGLAGALRTARTQGFDAVLSCGCDVLGLPDDVMERLGVGPAILEDVPIVGMWPSALSEPLIEWLTADTRNRSVYRFADSIGARRVETPAGLINANRHSDLPAEPQQD